MRTKCKRYMKFVAYLLVVHCMLVNNQIIYNFNISVDEDEFVKNVRFLCPRI